MSEPPPPDLLDYRGRLRRLAIALVVGAIAAGVVYGIVFGIAGSQLETNKNFRANAAGRFIGYFTGLAFVVAGSITHIVVTKLEQRRERREKLPTAKLRH
jgi:hypothetical protein